MRARQRHLNPGHLGMACAFDSRFISGLNNNDAVDTWTDRTANGRNATQATAAKKPTYKTGELNGNPGLSFDGGDCLATATFSASLAASAFVLFKASANGLIYERGSAFTNAGSSFIYSTIGATTNFTKQSGVYSSFDRANDWGIDSVWRLVSHEQNGTQATHKFYINGAVQSMTARFINDVGTASATLGVNIGARDNAASLAITGVYSAFAFGPFLESPLRRRLENSWAYSFKIACS